MRGSECLAYPAMQGIAWEAHYFLTPSRTLRAWEWLKSLQVSRNGKRASQEPEHRTQQRLCFPLSISQNSPRSLLTHLPGCITLWPPHSPPTHPGVLLILCVSSCSRPCTTPPALCRSCVNSHSQPAQLCCLRGRRLILSTSGPCPRENHRRPPASGLASWDLEKLCSPKIYFKI